MLDYVRFPIKTFFRGHGKVNVVVKPDFKELFFSSVSCQVITHHSRCKKVPIIKKVASAVCTRMFSKVTNCRDIDERFSLLLWVIIAQHHHLAAVQVTTWCLYFLRSWPKR